MTTPNQINGNFASIAQTDANGNVTGIQVAAPENIAIGGNTDGKFLQSDNAGALQWAAPVMSYGKIKKMTRSGVNGMFTLMEDGRLFLTHADNTAYATSYETHGPAGVMNINSFYGIEGTHEIAYPQNETGKIIDCDTYGNACYILYDTGNLYTWGYNTQGQLGLGDTTNRNRPTLAANNVVQVFVTNTIAVRTDEYQRLFIKKTDGKIYGCGYNAFGQLGIGTTANANSFVEIVGAGVNPKSVWNLGGYIGCLVVQRADGVVLVSGYNGYGQLGNNTTSNILTLTAILEWNNGDNTLVLEQATGGFGYIDSAGNNNCTLIMWFKGASTDLVKTCGSNNWNSIGNGSSTTDVKVPFTPTIPGTGRITSMFVNGGGPATVRILKSTGALYGWGYNGVGQLGIGNYTSNGTPQLIQSDVTELINIGDIYYWSYRSWTMIKKTDGFYYACGRNAEGQCGIGTSADQTTFVRMLYPRGTDIKFFGGYTMGGSSAAYFAVDQNGRWLAHGWTDRYGITNQQWGAEDRVSVPISVTPTALMLNQFI